MRINNDLFRICGVVDKKEFAWLPMTNHKIVDYRIELPNYVMCVEVNGQVMEFVQPVDKGLDHLRDQIEQHLNGVKEKRSAARVVRVG